MKIKKYLAYMTITATAMFFVACGSTTATDSVSDTAPAPANIGEATSVVYPPAVENGVGHENAPAPENI